MTVGEVFLASAQQVADPVEQIISAATIAVDVLLDPATDLINSGGAKLDDMESAMPTSA